MGGAVVGAATMTTTTTGTVPPPPMDCGATAVDNGREDLGTAMSKHRQWGQWTAKNDCHGKQQEQEWVGADEEGNQ